MPKQTRPGETTSLGPRLLGVLAEYPRFLAPDRRVWRHWLTEHHPSAAGVWLVTYKKNSGGPWLPYHEAVEEALCFGWIDSRPARLDDERTMLLFTPRKPGSVWARTNKVRVERLIADGQMTPAGLSAIERAKQDGSWTSLDEVEDGIVPPDLVAALEDAPAALRSFESFSFSARKQLLQWLASAKRPETRTKRIEQIVAAAAEGRRADQSRQDARPAR